MGTNIHSSENENVETFHLLCLDDLNENVDQKNTRTELRSNIKRLKICTSSNQFEKSIRKMSRQDRAILVLGVGRGQEILPRIHRFKQVSSIYIYGIDEEEGEQWMKQFPKIKNVAIDRNKLILQVLADQNRRRTVEEPLDIDILTTRGQSSTQLNGGYLHFQQFLDVIQRMKSRSTDSAEFHSRCTDECRDNLVQLAVLDEYEKSYSPDKALWWYSRDTFLYKILNRALRAENVELLVVLGSFIRDIGRALKQHQCLSPVIVYRGQLMATKELHALQNAIGELVSMKSFWSTTISREVALFFLGEGSLKTDECRVLFEIDIDPRTFNKDNTKPFADISWYSQFVQESEILIMCGSIFRLTNIVRNSDGVWVVQMTLCDDRTSDIQHLLEGMKKHKKRTDIRTLGDVLKDMGKFDLAEKYLLQSLNELPLDHISIGFVYISLIEIWETKNDIDKNIHWLEKSIEFMQRYGLTDSLRQGQTHNLIGEVHRLKGDYNQALDLYHKALAIFGPISTQNHASIGIVHNNICLVYQAQNNYPEALIFAEKSLAIRKQYFPENHREVSIPYYLIGMTYLHLGHYDLALENFEQSLGIRQKSLPPFHLEIGSIYQNMSLIYEKNNQYEQALIYSQKALNIYQYELTSQHPDVVRCTEDIPRLQAMF